MRAALRGASSSTALTRCDTDQGHVPPTLREETQ